MLLLAGELVRNQTLNHISVPHYVLCLAMGFPELLLRYRNSLKAGYPAKHDRRTLLPTIATSSLPFTAYGHLVAQPRLHPPMSKKKIQSLLGCISECWDLVGLGFSLSAKAFKGSLGHAPPPVQLELKAAGHSLRFRLWGLRLRK